MRAKPQNFLRHSEPECPPFLNIAMSISLNTLKLHNQRLEDLIETANGHMSLDIELILDQIINVLFSEQGGLIRKKLVESLVIKIDDIGWRAIKKAKRVVGRPIEVIKKRKSWNIKRL